MDDVNIDTESDTSIRRGRPKKYLTAEDKKMASRTYQMNYWGRRVSQPVDELKLQIDELRTENAILSRRLDKMFDILLDLQIRMNE
jgi:hypothetical protein